MADVIAHRPQVRVVEETFQAGFVLTSQPFALCEGQFQAIAQIKTAMQAGKSTKVYNNYLSDSS